MHKVNNFSSGGGEPGYWAAEETPTTVTRTSGTSWSVPSDWNDDSNTIECYGGGGGAGGTWSGQPAGSGGGAGGGYSKLVNFGLDGYSTLYHSIGAAGASTNYVGDAGGVTWVNRNSASAPTSSSQGCRANGGGGGGSNFGGDNPVYGGSGGTGQYGSVNRTGGDGGWGYSPGGGGGGGCAGTSSDGTDGGDGNAGGAGGSGGGGYAGAGGDGMSTAEDGFVYGGGGGGDGTGVTNQAGDGKQGIIVITYYALYWVPGT